MNWKTWIPLVLAIVLGVAAAVIARASLNRTRINGPPQPKTVKVVVAKGQVAPGQELTADLLALGPIASEAPPQGAFTDISAVVGRVANTPLFNGQPVLEDLLAPKGAGMGIQALLPRGMRAITVAVDETTGLAGMLLPGAHVDVVSTLNGGGKGDTVAMTIVQDVLVQAVGQRLGAHGGTDKDPAQPARTVTLVVTPRDAEAIELASSTGRTRLVLRGANDREASDSVGVTFVELRGDGRERMPFVVVATPPGSDPTAAGAGNPPFGTVPTTRPANPKAAAGGGDPFAEAARPKRTVAVFRGGSKAEVVFELPESSGSNTAVTRTNTEPVDE